MNVVKAYKDRISQQEKRIQQMRDRGKDVPATLLTAIERDKRMIRKVQGEQV